MALARIERTEEGECITRRVFPSSPSAAQQSMTITVNDQLTIDAGYWQECVEEDQTPSRLILPPANRHVPYRQALSYVEEATKDMGLPRSPGCTLAKWPSATVAVYLRGVSCIGDGEMALIDIEASAALASWIDLVQAHQQHFRKLVKSAAQLLPFPIARLDGSTYYDRFRALGAINSA